MLLFACSSNRGKLAEFESAARLAGRDTIDIRTLPGLSDIEPPEETGVTFEENAILKAVYYSRFTPEFVFADDSGLEVDALGGEPGVYSARYSGPAATDRTNIELLLKRLDGAPNRAARFVCVLALARAGEPIFTVAGSAQGEILTDPRGENGFGYDPVFLYPPLDRSFAELAPDAKFSVSHRGKALRNFFEKLKEHL